MAELRAQLGNIPAARLRLRPTPGTATEADLLRANSSRDALCELVDGVLVEKAMGWKSSVVALRLGRFLGNFVEPRNLGMVAGADGMLRLRPGLVRIPDITFIAWDPASPGATIPDEAILGLPPTLAVEVLSESNTPAEMARKRADYFAAGARLVWIVDPEARTVAVHTAPEEHHLLTEEETLDGGDILPGFTLPLGQLFANLRR